MNYFELFDLPVSLEVNQSQLTKSYYALSKQFHPDKFSGADDAEKTAALQKSAEINLAYKTLQKEHLTIRYVLELFDAAPEEGKEVMPQDFLMEMMDLNDEIMDCKMNPTEENKSAVNSKIEAFQKELDKTIAPHKSMELNAPSPEALANIKDYYLKSKYLKRVLDNLNNQEAEV